MVVFKVSTYFSTGNVFILRDHYICTFGEFSIIYCIYIPYYTSDESSRASGGCQREMCADVRQNWGNPGHHYNGVIQHAAPGGVRVARPPV